MSPMHSAKGSQMAEYGQILVAGGGRCPTSTSGTEWLGAAGLTGLSRGGVWGNSPYPTLWREAAPSNLTGGGEGMCGQRDREQRHNAGSRKNSSALSYRHGSRSGGLDRRERTPRNTRELGHSDTSARREGTQETRSIDPTLFVCVPTCVVDLAWIVWKPSGSQT